MVRSHAHLARSLLASIVALVATLALASSASAAVIFTGNPSGSAPPATLGPYSLTQFPDDPRPHGAQIAEVPSPLGGNVLLAPPMFHFENAWGSAWAPGAPRYTYFSNGLPTGTLTMPAGTGAFNFYLEPDDFGVRTFEAVAQDGTSSGSVSVSASSSGGRYFGFYATGPDTIDHVNIRNTSVGAGRNGFGIGAFGIAGAAPGEEQPDHIQCYDLRGPTESQGRTGTIRDQFGSKSVRIGRPILVCTPTDKNDEAGPDFDLTEPHYVCYRVGRGQVVRKSWVVANQFGSDMVHIRVAKRLCVISDMQVGGGPVLAQAAQVDEGFVDHFQCYEIPRGAKDIFRTVSAEDQFGTHRLRLREMRDLCAPAEKNNEGVPDLEGMHYACYRTDRDHYANADVTVTNQFGSEELRLRRARRLCTASSKTPPANNN
jgi:hypothetical protein